MKTYLKVGGLGIVCIALAGIAMAASDSGALVGKVFLGPVCPVVRQGIVCKDRPYQTVVDIFVAGNDAPIVSVTTNKNGSFRTKLSNGHYTVKPRGGGGETPPWCPAKEILISSRTQYLEFHCDSGIR